MLEGPASSSQLSTHESDQRRSHQHHLGLSSPLGAYLQSQSYQPPIEQWRHDADSFQDRLAAANYSFPPSHQQLGPDHPAASLAHLSYPYPNSIDISKDSAPPSMAPTTQQYPPTIHNHHHPHHRASTAASASQYSYGYGNGSLDVPPSLIDDHSSLPESCSIDTSLAYEHLRPHLLEEGPDGVLVQPQSAATAAWPTDPTTTLYECTFPFLGCPFTTPDEDAWRTHNLAHLHGNPPPRSSAACPLCDWGYHSDRYGGNTTNSYTAWDARLSHLAAHLRLGQSLRVSSHRPDSALYRYLWQKRIIDDAEYKELSAGGCLVAGGRAAATTVATAEAQARGPVQTTQGIVGERRDRNGRRYPRPRG